jgi:formate hydrogenlyase subunit 6/NADH:ubiquinone oxidoreductase subunit I
MKTTGKIGGQAIRSLFSPAATTTYPFGNDVIVPELRGKLKFTQSLCIGCKICMRDCPSNAIDIVKVEDKKFDAILDLAKCIYCGQCCDSCPKKALETTEEFELAGFDPLKLRVKI